MCLEMAPGMPGRKPAGQDRGRDGWGQERGLWGRATWVESSRHHCWVCDLEQVVQPFCASLSRLQSGESTDDTARGCSGDRTLKNGSLASPAAALLHLLAGFAPVSIDQEGWAVLRKHL